MALFSRENLTNWFGASVANILISWFSFNTQEKMTGDGGQLTADVMAGSIEGIRAQLSEYTRAIAQQKASVQRTQKIYNDKAAEADTLDRQALQLAQSGDRETAGRVAGRARVLRESLPQFKQAVDNSNANLQTIEANLKHLRGELEEMEYRSELADEKAAIADALQKANQISDVNLKPLQRQFEQMAGKVDAKLAAESAVSNMNSEAGATDRALGDLSNDSYLDALLNQDSAGALPSSNSQILDIDLDETPVNERDLKRKRG